MDELYELETNSIDAFLRMPDENIEVNLGEDLHLVCTFVSKVLQDKEKEQLIALLQKIKVCFAWDYTEMLGLERTLVEHKLQIKDGFKPYIQPKQRMSMNVMLKVKEEIERLFKARFIRTVRYAELLSNIILIIKKNGKLHICVDFRDINKATPKYECQ